MEDDNLDTGSAIEEDAEGYSADLEEGDFDEGAPAGDEASQDEDPGEPLTAGEPRDEQGGADSLESDAAEGTVPAALPQVPPGFRSWEEAIEARQRQQSYDQQRQQYWQAQQAQAAQQQQQAQHFAWNLPHEMTTDMRLAMQLRGTEAYQQLTPAQQQRADEQHQYVAQQWDRWTYDPTSYVNDMVLPKVAPALQQLAEQVAELRAAEFRRKNQDNLGTQEDVDRYLATVQSMSRDPYQAALEQLRLQKALEEAKRTGQGNKQRARDKQAKTQSGRGKPAHKGRTKGRRGKQQRHMTTKEKANPSAVAQNVLREMLASGELTPSDMDG